MSTAPRPRPRPRARARISASDVDYSSEISPSTSAASIQISESTSARQEDNELDAMFTKRRNASAWRDVDKKFKRTSSMRQESQDTEVERFGSEDTIKSPKPRQRNVKVEPLPAWTNAKNIAVLQISSDEEEENVHDSSNTSEWIDHSPKGKRKRERSRSITPPPALPEHQLYHARKLVRETLNAQAQQPPLTFTRDEISINDNIPLDPELACIAAQIRSEGVISVDDRHQSSSAEPTLVNIKVKWMPHPENSSDQIWLRIFRVNRDDELKELFESVSDEAGTRSVHLHVTHDGKRVFPSATPKALHIWSEAEFEACTTFTYEYAQERKHVTHSVESENFDQRDDHIPTNNHNDAASDAASDVSDDDGTFKITIRSTAAKDITVTVRSTTTCGAIVETFIKRSGLKANKKARLQIDGESMKPDVTIGDTDLEDGDMVDIVGI